MDEEKLAELGLTLEEYTVQFNMEPGTSQERKIVDALTGGMNTAYKKEIIL